MTPNAELWCHSRLRLVSYLNNVVEQDHRRIMGDPARARLRLLLDGTVNAYRHGGDGDDQKGADSRYRWGRRQGFIAGLFLRAA
jgi:hypothetical protein